MRRATHVRQPYFAFCSAVWIILLLLTGCTNATASDPPVPHITPLTLSPGAGSATVPAPVATDWTTYHHDNTRTGYLPTVPDPKQLTRTWQTQLDGAVYAEPLVVGKHVIVVTEGDSFYALDGQSGKVQWHTNVGTPVRQATLPCGDIDPLGITGTPVYDPQTGLVFAIAEITGPMHILVGVDVTTGQIKVRRSADLPNMEPAVHQQRAALLLSHGMVYWAYGGLAGDCGNYHGVIMAARTDGQGAVLCYQIPTPREGGIWATSGPAADVAGNIYVAVGNGATTQGDWDHSDAVLRLSPTLQWQDGFAPAQWREDNNTDADLGSMGPTLLPGGLLFVAGKNQQGYLLHAQALGGVGGQIQEAQVCNSVAMGGTATVGSLIVVPCSDGLQLVQVGSNARMTLGWHTAAKANCPPVIGGHTIYALNTAGTLSALDLTTGRSRATVDLGTTLPHFVTPTLSGQRIFIGTMHGVVAVTLV